MRKYISLQNMTGFVLCAFGAAVILGWIIHSASLVQLYLGMDVMVINTALGFILSGLALVCPRFRVGSSIQLRLLVGVLLVALACAVLAENMLAISLGIDLPDVHRLLNSEHRHPGRMTTNTCLSFLLVGIIYLLMELHDSRWRALAIQCLTFVLLLMGLSSFIGQLLKLEIMYSWFSGTWMGLPTAVGMVLLSVGIWASGYGHFGVQHHHYPQDQKIVLFSAAILSVIALISGLMGFATLQKQVQSSLSEALSQTLKTRLILFNYTIDQSLAAAQAMARRPVLIRHSLTLSQVPSDKSAQAAIRETLASVVPPEYLGVALVSSDGVNRVEIGQFATQTPIVVALNTALPATLLWDGQLLLRTLVPIRDSNGTLMATLTLEQPLPALTRLLVSVASFGETGETAMCVSAQTGQLRCFPQFRHPNVYEVAPLASNGTPLPMTLALAGKSGILSTLDYRNHQVIAAFAPVSGTNLGMVIKQDAAEIYQPVASQLQRVLPLILVLIAGGLLLLRSLVKPLATQLIMSQQATHEAHQIIAQKEQRIRAVVENIGEGIITIDEQGVVQSFNPAATAIFGYGYLEVVGRNITMLMPPEMASRHTGGMQRYLKEGSTRVIGRKGIELPAVRKDGTAFEMELTINVLQLSDSKLFVGIVRDITERKRTENALRESEERFRLMVEGAQDYALIMLSPDGHVVNWNAGAEYLKGYCAEEVVGKSFMMFYRPEDVERGWPQHLLATATAKNYVEDEGWRVRKDGSHFWASIVITALHDTSGQLRGFSKLTRDITQRKQVEKDLERARDDAEAASRAKSEFLANMSHEIRTPMNGVLGTVGLLLNSELTEEQRELAALARASGETLLTLINDILDFAKIEAGKLTIESLPFDLLLTVEEVTGMIAMQSADKNIDVIVRYPPSVPRHLMGDPGRIRQILINLTSNALKFTEKGQVLINIELLDQSEDRVALRISIEDSGIGASPDKLNQLFEKFTQADSSTTRRYGGTGLGLAISKQLVELMGGQIGAQSREGEGSTFWFTLNLPLQTEQPVDVMPSYANLAGLRVLIVDDNALNRRVLHEQIVGWKMRNGSCVSAEDALKVLRAADADGDPYQIAVVDCQMPDMDGEMLGTIIKADPRLRDIVLVMLTSLGHRGDISRLLDIGFAAYLVKPARQSELLATLVRSWSAHVYHQASGSPRQLEKKASASEQAAVQRFSARVLLAEDNVVNQIVASKMLKNLGCEVDIAVNGIEAVEMVDQSDYDLVFMDCEMPEMDGFEATSVIRCRNDSKALVPIVAVTAQAIQGDRERCLRAGMNDYITKPVQLTSFADALQRWTQTLVTEEKDV